MNSDKIEILLKGEFVYLVLSGDGSIDVFASERDANKVCDFNNSFYDHKKYVVVKHRIN